MNELTLVVPHDDTVVLNNTLNEIRAWSHEVERKIRDNADSIDASNYRSERYNAFDSDEKYLKTKADNLVDVVAKKTHICEILIEIAAARNRIKAEIKNREIKLRNLHEANDLKAKPRAWVVSFEATDDQFDAIANAAKKAGSPFEHFAVPQSDKAVKDICKWFDVNQ